MDDPRDILLETAVRPVKDNAEMRLAAIDYLNVLRNGRSGGESELIQRWERLDPPNTGIRWRFVLLGLVLMGSLGVALTNLEEVKGVVTDGVHHIPDWDSKGAEARIARNLDPASTTLLFGDLARTTAVKRKEALWRSDPENPAYYSEYALALMADEKPLPMDFLATARRIDPDNAWFTYLAAAAESKNSVNNFTSRRRLSGKPPLLPPTWEIEDRPRLERTMALLREAEAQGICETYFSRTLAKRLKVLPNETIQEKADSYHVLSEATAFPGSSTIHLGRAIAARAWLAGEENNPTDLRRAILDGDRLLRAIHGIEVGSLLEEIFNATIALELATNLRAAGEKVGLMDESTQWKETEERLLERREKRRRALFLVDGLAVAEGLKTRSDSSVELLATSVVSPPPLTDANLQPGRHQDHDRFARYACYFSWGFLGVLVGLTAAFRYRVPQVGRILAHRMNQLLMPSDWAWIGLAGILLPFLYVIVINRFTPWGGRGFGIAGSTGLLPIGQFVGLWVLWIVVPVIVVRIRLAIRAGIFGFSRGNLWVPSIAAACAAAYVPIVGWAAVTGTVPQWWVLHLHFPDTGVDRVVNETPLRIAFGMLGVPILWLFATAGGALLSGSGALLHRATAVRVLIPTYAMAMLLILILAPCLKWSEEHWARSEAMMTFDPTYPSWSRYEYMVSVQARKELRETLGYEP